MRWILTAYLLCGIAQAQTNLVPNGSFEEYSQCPWTGAQLQLAANWDDPNQASSDYFHSCSNGNLISPPNVVYGFQQPNDGEAFIGMYCFALNQPELRDYAQTLLSEPIYTGVRYKVSFYVSLAEQSRYAISSLGAHLSHQPLTQDNYWVIDVEPQIQNPAGNIIADTSGWVLITDTFASRTGGGEEWLTIGNFNYAAESDTFAFQPPNPDMGGSYFSYYYIDDVSVVALDSVPSGVGITEQETLGFDVWPNPATDVVRFRVLDSSARSSVGMTMRVLDAVGRLCGGQFPLTKGVSATGGGGISGEVDISTLPTGIYFLELTDQEGRKAVRKFIKE